MKLTKLHIQNFRGIQELDLDLTDDLGRTQDLIVIVGPNGSGKTSVLDAIWFGLEGLMQYGILRPGFRTERAYVVREGAEFTTIGYTVVVSKEEHTLGNTWGKALSEKETTTLNSLNNVKNPADYRMPEDLSGKIAWEYPNQKDNEGYTGNVALDINLARIRYFGEQLGRLTGQVIEDINVAGRVYLLEEERRIIADPITTVPTNADKDGELDIRKVLVDYGIKEKLGTIDPIHSAYRLIQESFNYICMPRRMGEVYALTSYSEYEIGFEDADGTKYTFDGLSSGERSVLNFLAQYFARQMQNSIVLIDEIETHLHPTWQRRLLSNLLRLNTDEGHNNQFIITTHSPTIMMGLQPEQIIELDKLDEPSLEIDGVDA
jgi:predicted ATPase